MNWRRLFGRKRGAVAPQLASAPSYTIGWGGQLYEFDAGKGSRSDFEQWFRETAPKLPACITCNRLIFPGQPVGKREGDTLLFISTDKQAGEIANQNKVGYMHMYWECCPSGAYFFGYVNDEGGVDPTFESGLSAAAEAMRTGGLIIRNL